MAVEAVGVGFEDVLGCGLREEVGVDYCAELGEQALLESGAEGELVFLVVGEGGGEALRAVGKGTGVSLEFEDEGR